MQLFYTFKEAHKTKAVKFCQPGMQKGRKQGWHLAIPTSLRPKIIHKIFETNYSFHVKQRATAKVQFLFFGRFLLVLTKFSFWEED